MPEINVFHRRSFEITLRVESPYLIPMKFLNHPQVSSDVELTKEVGAYKIVVDFSSDQLPTGCLYWDSTAAEIEEALELLDNVDSVHVERYGSGTEDDK